MAAALAVGANLILSKLKPAYGLPGGQRVMALKLLACAFLLLAVGQVYAENRTFGLVVVGLGGNEDYRAMFEEAASATLDAVNPASGVIRADEADSAVESGEKIISNGLQLLLETEANRDSILAQIEAQVGLANQHPENSRFMLILFGHGNFDGDHYRFNTHGADITASEILQALRPLKTVNQFLMFATSASGAVLDIVAQAEQEQSDDAQTGSNNLRRIVVTATKSGGEANAVQFPRYWSEALKGQMADTDHNELLTVTEAYEAASESVARHYENRQLLATEHSRVMASSEGSMVLARLGSLRGQENNAEVTRLLEQRQQLEAEFNRVRATRDSQVESIYLDELEQVLLDIARLQLRIDDATGWQPDGDRESDSGNTGSLNGG